MTLVLYFLILILQLSQVEAAIGVRTPTVPDSGAYEIAKTQYQSEEIPKTIYVISGTPLTSFQDPTGGMGDVAANYTAALELKKRIPSAKVTLIVTTRRESEPGVKKSSEIIQILAPDTRPEMTDVYQEHHGIKIVYLSKDPYSEDISTEMISKLFPRADLAVQFSANTSGQKKLLEKIGNVKIVFDELSARDAKELNAQPSLASRESSQYSSTMHSSAGPGRGGIYRIKEVNNQSDTNFNIGVSY